MALKKLGAGTWRNEKIGSDSTNEWRRYKRKTQEHRQLVKVGWKCFGESLNFEISWSLFAERRIQNSNQVRTTRLRRVTCRFLIFLESSLWLCSVNRKMNRKKSPNRSESATLFDLIAPGGHVMLSTEVKRVLIQYSIKLFFPRMRSWSRVFNFNFEIGFI